MQSLFNFFGKSTESQGLGFQNPQNIPAIKNIAIDSQEKAAAFLKILSDCSPEAGLHAFCSETEGKADTISSDMPANMSGLIPLKNFDKLPEKFNITIEGLSPEAVDSGRKANNEEKRLFVSLFLNPNHSFRSRVNPNENAAADLDKKDKTAVDPAINPEFVFATTEDNSEPALSADVTEKILSNDLMDDPLQKDGENITAPQDSSGNTSPKNNTHFNKSQVPPLSVPIDINKETFQTSTVSNDTKKETTHPSAASNDQGKEKFEPLAVSNLTNDSEDPEDGLPIQQHKEIFSVKKGIDKPQLFESGQNAGVKSGSNSVIGSTTQASTTGQTSGRPSDEAQSAISKLKATNENQSGSEIPIEVEKKAHQTTEHQSSSMSEKGFQKSQDRTADISTREFDFKKSAYNNSQEKSGGEHKNANDNNSDSKNENHTRVFKDSTIQNNSVFQKFHDNNALKSDNVSHSDVVKQSETKLSPSDTQISKQPEPNPIPSLLQNQTDNRMPINTDQLQQTELNAGSDTDKTLAKAGEAKNTGMQPDQIRQGYSSEERTDVIRQIVQHMNYRHIGTRSQMVVHLKPESLGRLRMQIETDNQQVTVRMISNSSSAKEIIEQHLHTLKQELKGHGLEVHKIDVTVQSDSDQQRNGHPSGTFHQNAHQKEYQNKRQQMSQEGSRGIKNKGSAADADRVDTPRQNTDKGEVDYFA